MPQPEDPSPLHPPEALPVLVIDDDPAIVRMISDVLEIEHIEVISAGTGQQGLALLETRPVRLAILDMQLPDTYGLKLFKQIHARWPELPCLFVSGVDQEMDIVIGLELGAEDYVTKPFRPRELLTRVSKILRRHPPIPPVPQAPPGPALESHAPASLAPDRLSFAGLQIDPARREVICGARPVTLTKAEFDLLWLLARHPGQVFSRRQILETLWPDDLDVSERIVDTHIRHLREKLEPTPARPALLHTVRGVGYRFGTP